MTVGVLRGSTRRIRFDVLPVRTTKKSGASVQVSRPSLSGFVETNVRRKTPCDETTSSVSNSTFESGSFTSESLWKGKSSSLRV